MAVRTGISNLKGVKYAGHFLLLVVMVNRSVEVPLMLAFHGGDMRA